MRTRPSPVALDRLSRACDIGDRTFDLALNYPPYQADWEEGLDRLAQDVLHAGAWAVELDSLEPHHGQIARHIRTIAALKAEIVAKREVTR